MMIWQKNERKDWHLPMHLKWLGVLLLFAPGRPRLMTHFNRQLLRCNQYGSIRKLCLDCLWGNGCIPKWSIIRHYPTYISKIQISHICGWAPKWYLKCLQEITLLDLFDLKSISENRIMLLLAVMDYFQSCSSYHFD